MCCGVDTQRSAVTWCLLMSLSFLSRIRRQPAPVFAEGTRGMGLEWGGGGGGGGGGRGGGRRRGLRDRGLMQTSCYPTDSSSPPPPPPLHSQLSPSFPQPPPYVTFCTVPILAFSLLASSWSDPVQLLGLKILKHPKQNKSNKQTDKQTNKQTNNNNNNNKRKKRLKS